MRAVGMGATRSRSGRSTGMGHSTRSNRSAAAPGKPDEAPVGTVEPAGAAGRLDNAPVEIEDLGQREVADQSRHLRETFVQFVVLRQHARGSGLELLLAALKEVAEHGGSEDIRRHIEARRDGSELALLRRRKIDGKLHGQNLPAGALPCN